MINLLRQFSIQQRLWSIVLVGIIVSTGLTFLSFTQTNQLFIESEKSSTRGQVEVAKKIINSFYKKEIAGELSRADAKHQALALIQESALDARHYIYVYHHKNFIVMHPFLKLQTYPDEPASVIPSSAAQFRQSLNDVANQLELTGSALGSVDFIEAQHPDTLTGFFNYLLYVSPSQDALLAQVGNVSIPDSAEEKIGYGSYFEPWDWIVFGSVYTQDLETLYRNFASTQITYTFAVIFGLALLTTLISYSITQPLSETVKHLERVSDSKILSEPLNDKYNDEVSAISQTFDQMLLRLRSHIEDEKDLEEKLRQSQKLEAIGQLTGGVAHDFNNLLTIVRGNLELALSEDVLVERVELITEAIKASDKGALLTQRLLAYSRSQALSPKVTDINQLIQGAIFLMERTIGENIVIEFREEKDLWPCYIDQSQMENALLNLAINSRDAMSNGGKITITSANLSILNAKTYDNLKAGSYVSISFSDNGSGISASNLERIFEPFFSTKAPSSGSGLGLSMIFGFVNQSNGFIDVSSEIDGGTTFTILLPRTIIKSEAAQQNLAQEIKPGQGESILVVEDDAALRALDTRLLKMLGYEVLSASSTDEAITLFNKNSNIKLLFTDIVLSETQTGIDLARILRNHRPNLKVLFTSGYSSTKALDVQVSKNLASFTSDANIQNPSIDAALVVGENFITKPFTQEKLSIVLRALLDSH